ncbi:MAG: alpha/beta hydrolase [SAR86 cluster bacterium]|uniref:Alpha/beta hydrolase n=1 Tax=SAR86 cluster bacterium TaxID=2030880 RepID=A0A2A4XBA2_9GAMM|nr:MAG: alpha/beta hydrolase [SAR86 cluster bacterium]
MPIRIRYLLALTLILSFSVNVSAQVISRESLGNPGPYQVAYYSSYPAVPEFSAATIYFPANKGEDFGGVAISPGFVESQENMSWWGSHLASHGFAVLTLDTNELRDDPSLRADALMAAIEVLRNESDRMGGTLRGKILKDRMSIMGHSMGGGGTLIAANAHGAELKAAIPFTPWQPDGSFAEISIPTLVIAGENDLIAPVADHALPHFESLSEDIPKMYLEIKGGNHFIANTDTGDDRLTPNIDVHDLVGGMAVAWLKLFVDGDEDYRELVFGEMPANDRDRLSSWKFSE